MIVLAFIVVGILCFWAGYGFGTWLVQNDLEDEDDELINRYEDDDY